MRTIKAPKAAVLEVLASEPLRAHTRKDIAKTFTKIRDGEADRPSVSTIRLRIKGLINQGVAILSLLDGYLLIPKDELLWTSEMYVAIKEAADHYESTNRGNTAALSVLNRVVGMIPENVKKQIRGDETASEDKLEKTS